MENSGNKTIKIRLCLLMFWVKLLVCKFTNSLIMFITCQV